MMGLALYMPCRVYILFSFFLLLVLLLSMHQNVFIFLFFFTGIFFGGVVYLEFPIQYSTMHTPRRERTHQFVSNNVMRAK